MFVILGAILALAAFGLFFVLGGVLGGARGVGGGSTPVVVAAKDIGVRTVITSDQLKVQGYAAGDVPPNAFTDIRRVQGSAAQLSIVAGQPITSNMVAKSPDSITGPQPSYLPLPSGYVAVTVPTGELMGVAGYPQAGDYLTVIANVNVQSLAQGGASLPNKTVTKTIYTNLHIIRVGPAAASAASSGQGQQQGGLASSLTVVMTQCDAEFMTWFLSNSNGGAALKYTLESYQDYLKAPPTKPDPSCPAITGTKGVTAADIDQRWSFSKA